jgi:hypothetical protein
MHVGRYNKDIKVAGRTKTEEVRREAGPQSHNGNRIINRNRGSDIRGGARIIC